MTVAGRRRLSVAEMLGALDAAYSGAFAAGPVRWAGSPTAPSENAAALPPRGGGVDTISGLAERGGRRLSSLRRGGRPAVPALTSGGVDTHSHRTVLVLAAHAGAGASTVSMLIADAAASSGTPTRLIECADPVRSGVAAATDAELGVDPSGWRCGRRGRLEVDRPSTPIAGAYDVPPARSSGQLGDGQPLTIVDAGWPAWDVLAADSWLCDLASTAQVVLACRASVPGVRQAEQLLAVLPGAPLIAAVGPTKWDGSVTATCGPRLRAANADGRVVAVPFDRALDVSGLTSAALTKALTAAGQSLASQLFTDLPAIRRAG